MVASAQAATSISEYLSDPITTPYAIFTPHLRVVFTQNYAYIHSHTDTSVYFTHLEDLIHMQASLASKISNYNITQADFPSFMTLNENLENVLMQTTLDLATALDSLEHFRACRPHDRSKRDLSVNQGILPGVGRALSWLTGTLSQEASNYINTNTHNINKLQKSELALVKVINNTAHTARANSVQLQSLRRKMNDMGNKLQGEQTKSHAVQIITSYYLSFSLTVEELQYNIKEMTREWQYASEGKLLSKALQGTFFDYVSEALDADTKSFPNLKHLVKKIATVSIEACQTHVWQRFSIPLLNRKSLPLFRIHHIPVPHNNSFDVLANQPFAVSWSDDRVFEFSKSEFKSMISLRRFSIAKPPEREIQLKDSCLYALANKLGHQCVFKHVQQTVPYVFFENNYLTYYLGLRAKTIAVHKCLHSDAVPSMLLGSGVIKVPDACTIKINNVVYQNTKPHSDNSLLTKPFFFTMESELKMITTNESLIHEDYSDSTNNFENDMASLKEASDLLGHFEVPTLHLYVASASIFTITFILFILVIILFLIICGPMGHCVSTPPTQIIKMHQVELDSL